MAARICARYSKGRNERLVSIKYKRQGEDGIVSVEPINDYEMDIYMIK
jgi:hypothetical protein